MYDNQTVEGHLIDYLFNKGLFENQARAVVDMVKALSSSEVMNGRWADRYTDYPPELIFTFCFDADDMAVKWIDENKPQHWAPPMFVRE